MFGKTLVFRCPLVCTTAMFVARCVSGIAHRPAWRWSDKPVLKFELRGPPGEGARHPRLPLQTCTPGKDARHGRLVYKHGSTTMGLRAERRPKFTSDPLCRRHFNLDSTPTFDHLRCRIARHCKLQKARASKIREQFVLIRFREVGQ